MKTFDREYLSADEIYERAMKSVVALPCQENYARELAEILSYHLKKNCLMDQGYTAEELPRQSAVIVAPSGQGKSHLLRAMAQACGVNVVVIECSNLTREGWIGASLSQTLAVEFKKLFEGKDPKDSPEIEEAFSRSIILLDEVDKLRNWGWRNDQGNAQMNLLQLFSGEPITFIQSDTTMNVTMETKRWTVLLAGAFSGLEDIVSERIAAKREIGFTENAARKQLSAAELLERAIPADLTKYGMMNELVGRIGTIIPVRPMELEDYRLLVNGGAGSVSDKQARYLSAFYGAALEITDGAAESIAQRCMGSKTGARAVNPLIDAQLRKAGTMLDRDSELGKVVLDAEGGELRVRYEKGPRQMPNRPTHVVPKKAVGKPEAKKQEAPKEEKKSKEQEVMEFLNSLVANVTDGKNGKTLIRGGTIAETVNLLYALYYEADGDPGFRETLKQFLTCSLVYLRKVYPQQPIYLSSLFRMAVNMQKGSKHLGSRFDKDVLTRTYDDLYDKDDPLIELYAQVDYEWKEDTAYRLVIALNKISHMLWRVLPKEQSFASAEKVCFTITADELKDAH